MPPKESFENKKKRAQKLLILLKKEYPGATVALESSNPLELLIATILSAQCTDERVNQVTKTLFKKYCSPRDYLRVPEEEFEQDIRSTGFYRNKARNIRAACQMLIDRYNSQVPKTMEELVELPGVARKTANIVLSHAYGVVEGIAVDTHVRRLAQRLGFTEHNDPDKIEADLCKLFPKKEWKIVSDVLILHGRAVCFARKPNHAGCVVRDLCPSRNI